MVGAVEFGIVDSVTVKTYGSVLTAAAPDGATVLQVASTTEFDPAGGQVQVNGGGGGINAAPGWTGDYIAISDPDAPSPTITLATPLDVSATVPAGATVLAVSKFSDTQLEVDISAMVACELGADIEGGELLDALVPANLAGSVVEGATVFITEMEPNRWWVTHVPHGPIGGSGTVIVNPGEPAPEPAAPTGQLRYAENSSGFADPIAWGNFGAEVAITGTAITVPASDAEVWVEWAAAVNISACTSNSVVYLGLYEINTDSSRVLVDATTQVVPNGYTAPFIYMRGTHRLGPTTADRTLYLAGYKEGTITVKANNSAATYGRSWVGAFTR